MHHIVSDGASIFAISSFFVWWYRWWCVWYVVLYLCLVPCSCGKPVSVAATARFHEWRWRKNWIKQRERNTVEGQIIKRCDWLKLGVTLFCKSPWPLVESTTIQDTSRTQHKTQSARTLQCYDIALCMCTYTIVADADMPTVLLKNGIPLFHGIILLWIVNWPINHHNIIIKPTTVTSKHIIARNYSTKQK